MKIHFMGIFLVGVVGAINNSVQRILFDRLKLSVFSPAEADLRIGEVQWGDSGVYICKVVISDDLEGPNEAFVELLVLGKLPLLNIPGVKDFSFELEK